MRDSNRLEAFTDAAFAFALTLLAISGDQMPESVAELKLALHQIPAFLTSAALLIMFWYSHQEWSKNYQTNDTIAVVLTSVLVCTILVYVYPLKMMFSGFFHWISAGTLRASYLATGPEEIIDLFTIYGFGYVTMCLAIGFLYWHSMRKLQQENGMTEQGFKAQLQAFSFFIMALPGVLSILLSLALPKQWQIFAAMVYASLGIVMPVYGSYANRALARWRATQEAA